ncbi:MAG: universal stress protein [Prolixibacteraceae bacterium]
MRYKLLDVLVLVPLNDEGKIVLKQAVILQKILSCRIFVLHVIPQAPFFTNHFNSPKIKKLKDEALQKLKDFTGGFFNGKIPEYIILKVIMGHLVHTLIEQSMGEDFLFIILKNSKHRDETLNLLDQNDIDKIIGHSFCPILSVRDETTPEEINNILIPIDISESTNKKLLWASSFAKKTKATIHIISALNINIDEEKSLALKNAERIKTMLQERGINSDLEILKVHDQARHEAVLSYISIKKPDFVIIRKHHIVSYFKTTIGDFAKEIIHGSTVPVFTVSQTQKDIESILP